MNIESIVLKSYVNVCNITSVNSFNKMLFSHGNEIKLSSIVVKFSLT